MIEYNKIVELLKSDDNTTHEIAKMLLVGYILDGYEIDYEKIIIDAYDIKKIDKSLDLKVTKITKCENGSKEFELSYKGVAYYLIISKYSTKHTFYVKNKNIAFYGGNLYFNFGNTNYTPSYYSKNKDMLIKDFVNSYNHYLVERKIKLTNALKLEVQNLFIKNYINDKRISK